MEKTAESMRVPRRRIWRSPLRRPAVISRSRRRTWGSLARFRAGDDEDDGGEHGGHGGAASKWPGSRARTTVLSGWGSGCAEQEREGVGREPEEGEDCGAALACAWRT